MEKYIDRQEAGITLASHLKDYDKQLNVIVLALPRGGVPVAYEAAKTLSLPLDIFIVRKLGVPGYEELAFGAIASGGIIILNEQLIAKLNLEQSSMEKVLQLEKKELLRRENLYREKRPFLEFKDKTLIVIDDGMATGFTMKAAIKALRIHNPGSIIIAVPVASRLTCQEMEKCVDKIVCPCKPLNFNAVGFWYENFTQTTDDEVKELLKKSNSRSKE